MTVQNRFLSGILGLLLLFFTSGIHAQLCAGSLGDPVVNITFSNSGAANVPGYTYASSSCPNDGFYTIASSTSGCFNNSWHTVPSDHTGGGYFMLVNASYQPGDFFVQPVTDLCPNTTYEFAAWIMNVLHRPGGGIKPNLTFKIEAPDGTVLQEFKTGDIAETSVPEWKQYGFYFTTPAGNAKIVLRITNNAAGGIGNDIALDDITFRPCGASIGAAIQNNSDTVNICEDNVELFTFEGDVSSAYQQPAYQWQLSTDAGKTWKDIPGATSATYLRQPTSAGTYWYRLAVLEARYVGVISCRISSNVVAVNVHTNPVVNAGPDRVIIAGDSITLTGKADGEKLVYFWSPDAFMSDASLLKPTIRPQSDIDYTLKAESQFGCTNEDQASVKVVKDIFVPNAFTPNDDGKNDTWKIPFLDPAFGAEVWVFNRYGELVYHTKASVVSWDGTIRGKKQPTGTYIYIITIQPGSFKRTGTVTLIR